MLAHRIAVITHLELAFHVTVCDFHPLQETVLFSLSHSWHSIKAPLLTHTHTHTHTVTFKEDQESTAQDQNYIFMKAIFLEFWNSNIPS